MASIFSGAMNEKACMKVMSNLKFKGECLATLHKKVNDSIKLIEALIVKNPSDENKMLLLMTLENYGRDKCVATYQLPVSVVETDEDGNSITQRDAKGNIVYEKDKRGNLVYSKHSRAFEINTIHWEVSLTKTGVRVHLKKDMAKKLKDELSSISGVKDLVVY